MKMNQQHNSYCGNSVISTSLRPKIGLLALTLELYETLAPGLRQQCEEGNKPVKQYDKFKYICNAVHKNPNMPITLACHAGAMYDYQEPNTKEDTPEGEEFNRKRDLDVLQILNVAPGCMLPARALFTTLIKGIS